MKPSVEPVSSALLVEPRIAAQLDLLQATQDARAPIALSCVATCGGALQALDSAEFDCLLLSTSLCDDVDERRDLAGLIQTARARGITVLAFGPGARDSLGLG
jgi:aryl-alcohol dehydrogenase-like predicted oxidoreductase